MFKKMMKLEKKSKETWQKSRESKQNQNKFSKWKELSIGMQNEGRWRKWKYTWREADVPLVGCFANDTENRFTAGIDNNSEEIKKVTWVTIFYSSPVQDGDGVTELKVWDCQG